MHKYKVLQRPKMCYILEKHGIQGYQIWYSHVSNVKYENKQISNMTFPCIKNEIHKYTNTKIRKYINTKSFKDPTCAIFLKGMGFNYIKYDIPVYSRMSIIIIISYHQKYKVLCIFLHFSALLYIYLHFSCNSLHFSAFFCISLHFSGWHKAL